MHAQNIIKTFRILPEKDNIPYIIPQMSIFSYLSQREPTKNY